MNLACTLYVLPLLSLIWWPFFIFLPPRFVMLCHCKIPFSKSEKKIQINIPSSITWKKPWFMAVFQSRWQKPSGNAIYAVHKKTLIEGTPLLKLKLNLGISHTFHIKIKLNFCIQFDLLSISTISHIFPRIWKGFLRRSN